MYYSDYLSRKIKRRKIILASIVVFIFLALLLIVLFSSSYSPKSLITRQLRYGDASCHYETEEDALPTIDERFVPSTNSIFFHETSCRRRLSPRQACSIEAAARAHPDWEIHVFFSAPVKKLSLADGTMELLKLMKNVFFWRLHIVDYAKGTPLEELVSSGALNETYWPIFETDKMLKYLTLYKWGGVYLDFDLIVTKPLGELGGNWAVGRIQEIVKSEAIALQRDTVGTFVSDAIVRKFAEVFKSSNRGIDIDFILKDICLTDTVSNMKADMCLALEVYPPEYIHKVRNGRYLRLSSNEDIEPSENAYFIQMLTGMFQHSFIDSDQDSKYSKIAKRYCPIIYENYRCSFGV